MGNLCPLRVPRHENGILATYTQPGWTEYLASSCGLSSDRVTADIYGMNQWMEACSLSQIKFKNKQLTVL